MGGWVPELTEKKAGFFPPMKTQTDQTKGGMILWSLLIALDWINLWLEPSTQEHTHLTPLIWHGSTLFFSSLASEANLVSVKAAENLIKKRSRVSGRQGKRARASERERKCGLVMKNCLLAHRVNSDLLENISYTEKEKPCDYTAAVPMKFPCRNSLVTRHTACGYNCVECSQTSCASWFILNGCMEVAVICTPPRIWTFPCLCYSLFMICIYQLACLFVS